MDRLPDFIGTERLPLAFELMHSLIDSSSFSQLHESTEQVLERIFETDHVALCLMNPELPTGFEWKARTTGLFLQGYYQWFQSDFVFRQLSRAPNTALSDTEMLAGRKLESTETYRRSREADLRLRRVLSVLIVPQSQQGQGAVALYRDRARPFSEAHRRLLQWFTPSLTSAFQNVMRFASLGFRHQLLEMLSHQTSASLVLTEQGREILRTQPVSPLLDKWFQCSGIPQEWVERLKELVRAGTPLPGRDTWSTHRPDEDLKVTFQRLPRVEGRQFWEVRMEEYRLLPEAWRRLLTPRQIEVATCLVREGCDDEELARLLKGNRARYSAQTVKKHLQAIYDAVGADSRVNFVSRALRP